MSPRVPVLPRRVLVLAWLSGAVFFIALLAYLLQGQQFPLLQTRGEIASRQRDLLLFATALSLLVLVPVYFMIFFIAWRYREGHKRSYKPAWDGDRRFETIWWAIPIAIILVLSVVTWKTSHSLDPYKPLASTQEPLKIQVVALQWKWLFLYPEERVASINEVVIPADRPVEFSITSDAPMNSFWIPQLAGQIYAMSGMSTKLNLKADYEGQYRGMSANISGKGFSDMHFTVLALSQQNYERWISEAKEEPAELTMSAYDLLAKPSTHKDSSQYRLGTGDIYGHAIMKYMAPAEKSKHIMDDAGEMKSSEQLSNMEDM